MAVTQSFFFSSRRRHTRSKRDWSSDVCSSDLGAVGLTGLRAESPFLRGLLDRIGIEPSFQHREQYKSAANILTETEMPAPQREELDNLLGAMAGQITQIGRASCRERV